MSTAAKDPRINDLFTEGSHHRNGNRSEPKRLLWQRPHPEKKLSLPSPVQQPRRPTTRHNTR